MLIDSVTKGMKNEVSFVRYHFIQFATILIIPMKKILKPADFTKHIIKIVSCMCDLLRHVDVTLFSNTAILQTQFD